MVVSCVGQLMVISPYCTAGVAPRNGVFSIEICQKSYAVFVKLNSALHIVVIA